MSDLSIKGIQKTSLIDFPPYIVSTLFLSRCNMRCPYCQNPDLINNHEKFPDISIEKIIDFLKSRIEWIDGVCITGGEPTIHKGLVDLAGRIKKLGLKVKIDTNGLKPDAIRNLIDAGVVDYIAMDIKSSLKKYDKAAGVKVDKSAIQESVDLLMNGDVDYEFRTTAYPDFFTEDDAKEIGKWLKGGKRYFVQQFSNRSELLSKTAKDKDPYPDEKVQEFAELMKPYFGQCETKNLTNR